MYSTSDTYICRNSRDSFLKHVCVSDNIKSLRCSGGFSSLLKGWLHKAGGLRATKAEECL